MTIKKLKIILPSIAFLIFTFLFLISRDDNVEASPLDSFAQCLTDRGVVMYGAEWCPHCQTQKKMFGKSFKYINYVECPQDPKRCLAAGIEGYPTWVINGEKLIGEQDLEILSKKTNCQIIEVPLQ